MSDTILTKKALLILTNTPAIVALTINLEIVPLFSGQRTPMPPIHIPILATFAKPQSEITETRAVLASREAILSARSLNAINSLRISFLPRSAPSNKISEPLNPRRYPNGAKI